MKIVLNGIRLDTTKAKLHVSLDHHDGSNMIEGDVYQSASGKHWYVYTPSQWSNGHRWEMSTPTRILEDYGRELSDADREAISTAAGLEWE